jgi:hypothetical protein
MNRGRYVPETRRGCQEYVVENCGLEEPRPLLTLIHRLTKLRVPYIKLKMRHTQPCVGKQIRPEG